MEKDAPVRKKALLLLSGVLFSLLLLLPYLFCREALKQYSTLGYLGLLVSCALSNLSMFLPSSATVYVLLAATALNPLACILVGALGTAMGEQASYLCGRLYRRGKETLLASSAKQTAARNGRVAQWLRRNAFLTVFLFALAPLPFFDLAGIGAGMAKMPWPSYLLAAFLGKTLKFSLFFVCFHVLLPAMDQLVSDTNPVFHTLYTYVEQLLQNNTLSVAVQP